MNTLFMETTKISTVKTVTEIQEILGRYGASKVVMDFVGSQIDGIAFMYEWEGGQQVPFKLPCRWKEVETILRSRSKRPGHGDTYEDWARRVAWRQILRWIQAQMALVETNMVKVREVFLPYVIMKGGKTMFDQVENKGLMSIEFKG